jgi:hypothetical protein
MGNNPTICCNEFLEKDNISHDQMLKKVNKNKINLNKIQYN